MQSVLVFSLFLLLISAALYEQTPCCAFRASNLTGRIVNISPDEKFILTVTSDEVTRIFDINGNLQCNQSIGSGYMILDANWTSLKDFVVLISNGKAVRYSANCTELMTWNFQRISSPPTKMAFTYRDNQQFIAFNFNNRIQVYSMNSNKVLQTYNRDSLGEYFVEISYSQNGEELYIVLSTSYIERINIKTGERTRQQFKAQKIKKILSKNQENGQEMIYLFFQDGKTLKVSKTEVNHIGKFLFIKVKPTSDSQYNGYVIYPSDRHQIIMIPSSKNDLEIYDHMGVTEYLKEPSETLSNPYSHGVDLDCSLNYLVVIDKEGMVIKYQRYQAKDLLIWGYVVVGVVLLGLLGFGVYWIWRKYKTSRTNQQLSRGIIQRDSLQSQEIGQNNIPRHLQYTTFLQ